ncbi:MAG TPA: threonine-phosphate decarboxylase CobD [Pseudolabrys sp.]|nr:threonine-phosphate decarboxylase CobD [Pseudolabrys sp.]
MLIAADTVPQPLAPLAHGGNLAAVRQMFPDAPEPFIDLSTGINPYPYPLPQIPRDCFTRLPDRASVRRLAAAAARSYGAPSDDCVVPAPGTQILLPQVAMLVPPGRAAILGPTYAEHMRAAVLAGHRANEVYDADQLRSADLAVIVNPNNPDGRVVPKAEILDIARDLRQRDGILVIDEAFADVAPPGVSLAGDVDCGNIVVLRSFGKFFGLAGLRLGFAIATPHLAKGLDLLLGPWAVAGPAIFVGEQALADTSWKSRMLECLAAAAQRLDLLLAGSGLEIIGGTSLYRLTQSSKAHDLFNHLGRAGIVVRTFAHDSTWLRWGLPATEAAWQRLNAVLSAYSKA